MVAHPRHASACPFSRPARTRPLQGAAVSKLSAPAMANFLQVLLAVVLGNVAYFVLAPSFPPLARHRPFHFDLGMAIDFWFCLVAYGLIRTARRWK